MLSMLTQYRAKQRHHADVFETERDGITNGIMLQLLGILVASLRGFTAERVWA